MGELIWKVSLILFLLIVVNGGLMDLGLWLMNQPTISDWLRENPAYFWWPVSIVCALFVILAVHLFVLPKLWS